MKTESMEIITGIKNMLATLFSITLAYFAPVKDMVFVIFFIFAINCLSIYIIGEKMKNLDGALQCITGIVYAVCYFYGVNTLRNMRKLFPHSRPLNFIYYVLSFEVVRKIPYLQQFLDNEKKEEETK